MSNKMDAMKTLLPNLRFPEFESAGGWEIKQLGELLSNSPDYGLNAPAVTYSEKLPTYLRITDISEEGYFLKENKVSVNADVTNENYLVEGDIVLARTGASVGKSYRYRVEDGKLVFAGYLIRIKPDKKRIDSSFLFNFLSTDQYWNWISVNCVRGGQPGINASEYASLSIPIPPFDNKNGIAEQQKIADCLTSLDDLIAAQSQKVEALQDYKKGLMQNLFPAEGESVPRLRFPEFQSAGEWEEKTLESVCDMQAGQFVSAPDISEQYKNGLYPCYGGNGLRGYVSTFTHSGEYSLIGRQGALCGNVNFGVGKFHATEHAVVATEKNNIDAKWLFYTLGFLNLNQYATGQAQPGLSVTVLEKVNIAVPTNKKEQQRIAELLSAIDEQISVQGEAVAALKVHKKGLMQQLFPSEGNLTQ